ncbi:MAG: nitrogenase component 1 [Lachnospiraceae bacterium]|nr:nitrogenase component 1 [Lachnospiraceae bacterium]
MSQLTFYLAPFSSDYAGACSALFDLNAMVVIHDGHCCTSNYTSFDEPRWFGRHRPIYCSGLREIDAIMGNDRELLRKITMTLDGLEKRPDFIALLGSPVPSIIGTDFQGVSRELESEVGIPVIGLATTGLSYYDRGIDLAMQALARRFCDLTQPGEKGRVNVLGLTPLDFSDNENAADLLMYLCGEGWDAHSFMMGTNIEDIREASRAEVNLVASRAGIGLADWMEKSLGIPWVSGTVFGTENRSLSDRLQKAAEGGVSGGDNRSGITYKGSDGETGGLIIGDQIIANSIRERLEERYGIRNVAVGSFFGLDTRLSRPQDLYIRSEEELMKLLRSGKWGMAAADPLIFEIPGAERLQQVDLPHVAVSSRLYWHDYLRFGGKEGDAFLERCAGCL